MTDHDDNLQQKDFSEYYQDQALTLEGHQGWQWIKDSWALFKGNIPMWLIVLIVYFACFLVLSSLSGSLKLESSLSMALSLVIAAVIKPLSAGVAYCAHRQKFEHDFEISDFFVGFKRQTSQLMGLGIVLALLTHLVILLLSYSMYGEFIGIEALAEKMQNQTAGDLQHANPVLSILGILLYFVVLMVGFLSAPLVFFNNISMFEALKKSILACVTNIAALIVYIMVVSLLFLASVMTAGIGFVLLIPIMMISSYAVYASIFNSGKIEDLSLEDAVKQHHQKVREASKENTSTLDA